MKRPATLEQYPEPTSTDWTEWRKCTVCGVATGQACRSLSSTVVAGQPDGQPFNLPRPHTLRKPRTRGGLPMPLIRADRFARPAVAGAAATPPPARRSCSCDDDGCAGDCAGSWRG